MRTVAVPALALLAAAAAPAHAVEPTAINTGDATGAYHTNFCPAIEKQLAAAKFDYQCTTSAGTAENLRRVAQDPRQLGYGQADVLALESPSLGGAGAFTKIRVDDVRECVFAVTRNAEIQSYGEVAVFAGRLRFVLPPPGSGSSGTFRFLQQIDGAGLGRAGAVMHTATTDEAIRMALSADDTVALFVQFPDPDNVRFKLVQELGGHIVPVIDRTILRQQVDGQKIYFAQETQVTNARWLRSAQKVVTACTPLVLFTGATEKVSGEQARQDHRDLIATLKALKAGDVMAQPDPFARLWRRTKEISAESAEKLMQLSDEARTKARPYLEQAKEATEKAVEAAKPYVDKAKELGAKAYEKAKEDMRDLMEKTKPEAPKK